jgi:hypothetical protein
MADDDTTLPDAYDLVPVDHTPQFSDAPIPKAGQTIQQPNVMGDITSMPGKVASAVGDVTGVSDAYKAATGQMTPDEAQMFALGALPMLAGGPEAKAVQGVAEDIAPAVAKGIRAYHGSPYDFNQFDLSKIGTGEGAQAYGHGLYFAENPEVAEEYKKTLTQAQLQQFQDNLIKTGKATKPVPPVGKTYEVNIKADPEHFLDWDKPLSEQSPKVQEAIKSLNLPDPLGGGSIGTPNHMMMSGQDIHASLKFGPPVGFNDKGQALFDAKNVGSGDRTIATQALRDAGIPGIKYLDQFSRFGNIPNPVKDTAARIIDFYGGDPQVATDQFSKRLSGMRSERSNDDLPLRHDRPADPQQVLDLLKSGWNPKLDETRNYVVFNDKIIDIVKKYGLAGLVAGGASHFSTVPVDHQPDFGDNQQGMATGGGVKGGVKVDATHDGPWMSCMSIDGQTMYRNKNIPATAHIKGKTVDVDDMLLHHEVPEREDLEKLIEQFKARHHREPNTKERKGIYLKAHNRSGTPNERAHAKKIGVDWKAWSAWCRGEESKIEKMKFTNQPKDADVKPVPHSHGDLEAEDKAA